MTDSISFCYPDGRDIPKDERKLLLEELNKLSPELIIWSDDGYYKKVIVLKAKNYILYDPTKEKEKDRKQVKGSAFKSASKEPAVAALMQDIVNAILEDKQDTLVSIYEGYVKEALNVQDMSRWSAKKTLSEAVMACEGYVLKIELRPNSKGVKMPKKIYYIKNKEVNIRTNEVVIWDAVKDEELVQQGDKVYLYPTITRTTIDLKIQKAKKVKKQTIQKFKFKAKYVTGLSQSKHWNKDKPNHDVEKLLERLYDTMCIFETILDINLFKNYSLKENYKSAYLLLDNVR